MELTYFILLRVRPNLRDHGMTVSSSGLQIPAPTAPGSPEDAYSETSTSGFAISLRMPSSTLTPRCVDSEVHHLCLAIINIGLSETPAR